MGGGIVTTNFDFVNDVLHVFVRVRQEGAGNVRTGPGPYKNGIEIYGTIFDRSLAQIGRKCPIDR